MRWEGEVECRRCFGRVSRVREVRSSATNASRAVGVVSSLLSDTQRDTYIADTRSEYNEVAERHERALVLPAVVLVVRARADRAVLADARDPIHVVVVMQNRVRPKR